MRRLIATAVLLLAVTACHVDTPADKAKKACEAKGGHEVTNLGITVCQRPDGTTVDPLG